MLLGCVVSLSEISRCAVAGIMLALALFVEGYCMRAWLVARIVHGDSSGCKGRFPPPRARAAVLRTRPLLSSASRGSFKISISDDRLS